MKQTSGEYCGLECFFLGKRHEPTDKKTKTVEHLCDRYSHGLCSYSTLLFNRATNQIRRCAQCMKEDA